MVRVVVFVFFAEARPIASVDCTGDMEIVVKMLTSLPSCSTSRAKSARLKPTLDPMLTSVVTVMITTVDELPARDMMERKIVSVRSSMNQSSPGIQRCQIGPTNSDLEAHGQLHQPQFCACRQQQQPASPSHSPAEARPETSRAVLIHTTGYEQEIKSTLWYKHIACAWLLDAVTAASTKGYA